MPTQTSSVAGGADASLPTMFDFSPVAGDPDMASASQRPGPLCATRRRRRYTPAGGTVTAGGWSRRRASAGRIAGPAPGGHGELVSMTATTKAFDPAVTSDTGDLWLAAINPATTFTPVVINPGQTATINVTITPAGASGTVVQRHPVRGRLRRQRPPYGQEGGDELASLPYAYTVGS